MNFKAIVRREKPRGTPVSASVSLHPYRLPVARYGGSLKGWETSFAAYSAALAALREVGVPDDASLTFISHRGHFGDRENTLIETIRADWTEL